DCWPRWCDAPRGLLVDAPGKVFFGGAGESLPCSCARSLPGNSVITPGWWLFPQFSVLIIVLSEFRLASSRPLCRSLCKRRIPNYSSALSAHTIFCGGVDQFSKPRGRTLSQLDGRCREGEQDERRLSNGATEQSASGKTVRGLPQRRFARGSGTGR